MRNYMTERYKRVRGKGSSIRCNKVIAVTILHARIIFHMAYSSANKGGISLSITNRDHKNFYCKSRWKYGYWL